MFEYGKRLKAAGATAFLLAALAACGGGGHAGGSPSPDPVHGLKDTTRHVSRQTTRATRPHLVKRCTTGTHQVRHSSRSGSGRHRRTRTWYTTERYQDCHKVRSGTETYRRETRPERWCVRLDDVNGNRRQDDVWYRVDRLDYNRVLDADDRTRVQFVPLYPDTGC
ncbi:hypothetical protein [Streptomyces barringtoniae]|uniref:hypothetical protein n=1 Tax=Streptomyces barringtoniae TaxID=2892029 RepID=UPI001E509519|nr:hypothetical protein [Streptomyces barringtoniae]MCC5477062.1 hypothetical protein [Streptomyces barringtoniae]